MSDLSIIIALIFAGASLAVYGTYRTYVFNRRDQRIINRRIEHSKRIENPSSGLQELRRERGFLPVSNPFLRQFSDWLAQTGVRVQRLPFVLFFILTCLLFVLIFSVTFNLGLLSTALAVLAAAAVMLLFLARARGRRIAAFSELLPDAIDIIVRGVRVGLPFSSAISLVAREMPDPIGSEFEMLSNEMAFGLDVRTALENLHRRVGQEDLLFLTVAVGIQTQTGGNLGEILARLSRLMRNRETMRLKIRALSAEGRASAYALSAFPFILFVVVNFLSPTYYGSIRSHPIVEPAIYLALFLLIVGNFMIYRMVNFKY